MPRLNSDAVVQYQRKTLSHKQTLERLMSESFDVTNPEHLSAVKRYVDVYELQSHQMYALQALGEVVKFWGACWALSYALPIPELVTNLLAYGLYAGGASLILKGFNYSNFMEQTQEMQVLYNWCMKGSRTRYDDGVDNTQALQNPDIQRFIRVLAPMSSPEFMVAWPRVTKRQPNQTGLLTNAYNYGASLVNYGASFFKQTQPGNPSLEAKINQLKADVELGLLEKGSFEGMKQAIEYGATSLEFKSLIKEKAWDLAKEPLAMVQESMPQPVPHLKFS